jgi:hypothetical protein
MSMKSLLRSIAGALLLLFPLGPVSAQDPPSLSTLTELKCTFPVMSTGTWTKEGDATNEARKSELTLAYQDINTQEGTAEVKGQFGNLYITVRLVSGNLHFLATDSAGPVYMTTVFNSPSRPGKFKAVHSRHEFTVVSLPGYTSRPEQYIGECQIVK